MTPLSIRKLSLSWLLALPVYATALLSACSESHDKALDSGVSASSAADTGVRADTSPEEEADPEQEPEEVVEPGGDIDASEPEDDAGLAAQEDAAEAEPETMDAEALDAGQAELDAATPEGDAAAATDAAGATDAAADAAPADAAADARVDAATCPAAQPADACGVCGGDGSSCRHPLAGHYAARTQFYARQGATIEGTPLDLISKGSVLSVVDVNATGVLTEHYCFFEIVSSEGLFVWSAPNTVQQVPDTSVPLTSRSGRYVRPLASHRAYFGWSPQAAPANCVTGQRHSSGCLCGAPNALPTDDEDCRLRDIDGDGDPGGAMYLDFTQPSNPATASTQLKLDVVALFSVELSLEAPAGGRVLGDIGGGMEQAVLGMDGALASAVGGLDNAMCDTTLGHVELVRGDFSCSSILAGRAADIVDYNIFDATLDAAPPTVATCDAPPGS